MGDGRGVQEGGDVGTLMLIRDVARKKPTKHCNHRTIKKYILENSNNVSFNV